MSVLGAPEPAPAGLWESALDHALSAGDDEGLDVLVPDLWNESGVPPDDSAPVDLPDVGPLEDWDFRDRGNDPDNIEPWDVEPPTGPEGGDEPHGTDPHDPGPWPASW